MAMSMSKYERDGDEFYTPAEYVDLIAKRYKKYFDSYDYIWIPFNAEGKPMVEVMKKYYGAKIVTTPKKYYSDQLGFNDFFVAINDSEWCEFLNNNNVLVFDNPPFSIWGKIAKELNNNNQDIFGTHHKKLDYILFADALTGLNKKMPYHILGKIPFEEPEGLEKKGKDKRIFVALFSPLFSTIETSIFHKHFRKLEYTEKINIPTLVAENNGFISSARIANICQRGYVFDFDKFSNFNSSVFGGAAKYQFSKEELGDTDCRR